MTAPFIPFVVKSMHHRSPFARWLAAVTLLAFTQCTKKSDPVVPNPIPANSAALKVDGVAYPVSMAHTSATVDAKTGELLVGIYSGSYAEPYAYFNIREFHMRAETIKLDVGSGSGLFLKGGQWPDGRVEQDYRSAFCAAAEERRFEVTEVNQEAHTVSVKFSGNACSGSGVKQITEGQMNLPYVVR